ncbi:Inositol 2-dehydrogenase [Pirellulimonas nuda]|uniref:Inositol 2-dehydrogenase n=2 Tax=Pirellulimonas nuda TaxID=2528009 RepID=A0A518DFZ9_9BACT|nr:Inositol 2-dehydrogenase [Pirellulimonas nuda]
MGNLSKNLVAICDVDQTILNDRAGEFRAETGRKLETYSDYRRLLENQDIDAVSIATPNHTHSLIAIAAINAGKDVYVEKPVSHNVWEGRQLSAAARKSGRVVQCGTQSRSSQALQEAVKWVRGGGLGEIRYALGTCFKPRQSIGKLDSPLTIPSSVDYDLWCGPAEKVDLFRPKLHYDWHWDFNTGAGDMGNQGIHQMDVARWFLGEDGVAPRCVSIGARLGYDDAGNTPNTQVVLHDYPTAPLIFETRGLPRSKAGQRRWGDSMDRFRGSQIGVIVQCQDGYVHASNDYENAAAYDNHGKEVKSWRGGGNHHANWLEAVAAHDPKLLNAEVRQGHVSSALCHIGNVSHRLGEQRAASDIANEIAGNALLSGAFERMASHLRANEIDVDGAPGALVMGPWLEIDPKSEQFKGNAQASKLRSRDYRSGFEIPEVDSTV